MPDDYYLHRLYDELDTLRRNRRRPEPDPELEQLQRDRIKHLGARIRQHCNDPEVRRMTLEAEREATEQKKEGIH